MAGSDDGAAAEGPGAFALSRIHAEGWKAARTVDGSADDVEAQAQRLNPYKSAIERARWRAGFDAALARPRQKGRATAPS